jgi:hypothetical protein
MTKPAKPSGRKPVENIKVKPKTNNRQSSGPSLPSAQAPAPLPTPGGEPKKTGFGDHLQ